MGLEVDALRLCAWKGGGREEERGENPTAMKETLTFGNIHSLI